MPPTDTAADVVELVLRVAQAWRAGLNAHLGEFELNEVRFAVLTVLRQSEPHGCVQNELARRLQVSDSSVSGLIERMRSDGLLVRRCSRTDRRKRVLQLTRQGRELQQSIHTQYRRQMAGLLEGLPVEEVEKLASILRTLNRTIVSPCAAGGAHEHAASFARFNGDSIQSPDAA